MPSRLENIRVVLAGPLYGGNVGAACRAMANMGLSDLVIAAPQPLNTDEALQMACAGGAPIFNQRRETLTLAQAVSDCVLVAGTSARKGLYRSHSCSPRQAVPHLLQAAQHGKAALVFGRETHGLSNEELALCTDIIRIPTRDPASSLNLAQSIVICLYELYVAADEFEPAREASPPAPSELRERMLAVWEQALLNIGFMKADKAMHMMMGIRRIFSRDRLTINDVRILMGIGRQMLWTAARCNGPPEKSTQEEDGATAR